MKLSTPSRVRNQRAARINTTAATATITNVLTARDKTADFDVFFTSSSSRGDVTGVIPDRGVHGGSSKRDRDFIRREHRHIAEEVSERSGCATKVVDSNVSD